MGRGSVRPHRDGEAATQRFVEGSRTRGEGGDQRTSVVFYSNVYPGIDVIRGYVDGLLAVYVDVLVFRRVVGGAGGDAENVLLVVRHHGQTTRVV